jgi:hypothetical protein
MSFICLGRITEACRQADFRIKNHAARSLAIVMANMKIKSNATTQNSLHQPYGCMGERLWRPYGMDRRQW